MSKWFRVSTVFLFLMDFGLSVFAVSQTITIEKSFENSAKKYWMYG